MPNLLEWLAGLGLGGLFGGVAAVWMAVNRVRVRLAELADVLDDPFDEEMTVGEAARSLRSLEEEFRGLIGALRSVFRR